LLSVARPAADTLSNLEFVTKSNHLPVVRQLRFGCAATLAHEVLVATACLLGINRSGIRSNKFLRVVVLPIGDTLACSCPASHG
jgi:hypothetical protein